ncbi:DUF6458 family protein [Thermomonospora umbrina]|uniref:DUF6458 domain-containing protein n=1 Tax=Thermomonospora umbrina TaxID=111806 RepID=A0A3D9T0B7_9ACTN|nr:DUF6458 family protein [Thermomonospora umbrina]REE97271.1 hypothetical protein DFJ69_2736 [Thermomonospora umbrina]
MGFGASLTFIAIGAILAFALNVDLSGVNIQMVGWILILVGAASMIFTFVYTRPRRRGEIAEIADEEPVYLVHPEESAPAPEPPTVDQPIPPHVHTDPAGHADPAAAPTRPPRSAPLAREPHEGTQATPQPHGDGRAPQPGRHFQEGHTRTRPERL